MTISARQRQVALGLAVAVYVDAPMVAATPSMPTLDVRPEDTRNARQSPGGSASRTEGPTARSQPTPSAPRFDVRVSVGDWFALDQSDFPVPTLRPEILAVFGRQLSGGYYWSDHLKSEVEWNWTGTKRGHYDNDPTCVGTTLTLQVPGVSPLPQCPAATSYLHHDYRFARLSLSQAYAFRGDGRLRPYVGGGAGFDFEHRSSPGTWEVRTPGGYQTIEAPATHVRSRRVAHTFGKIGVDVRIGTRAFVVTEVKVGPRLGTTAKMGVGLGF